ncbi:MAG TPA: iron-sulfur cluster assembly protein [Acidobacteriaceae bacterium]
MNPTLTETDILAALRDCYDPEIACSIVDLGLVHAISIAPDPDAPGAGIPGVPPRHRVHIALTLTEPNDSAEQQIVAQIEGRLAAFETISHTHIEVVDEPRWTPERISAEARTRLSLAVASNQPKNALIQIQTNPGKTHA